MSTFFFSCIWQGSLVCVYFSSSYDVFEEEETWKKWMLHWVVKISKLFSILPSSFLLPSHLVLLSEFTPTFLFSFVSTLHKKSGWEKAEAVWVSWHERMKTTRKLGNQNIFFREEKKKSNEGEKHMNVAFSCMSSLFPNKTSYLTTFSLVIDPFLMEKMSVSSALLTYMHLHLFQMAIVITHEKCVES